MAGTDVTFVAEPTYKICVTYRKSVKAFLTAFALLDNRAGVKLKQSASIQPKWRKPVTGE